MLTAFDNKWLDHEAGYASRRPCMSPVRPARDVRQDVPGSASANRDGVDMARPRHEETDIEHVTVCPISDL
ncbi:hypothetical protein XAP6164_1410003 [Xanthomonas phaseoli pv. phaseoli]|nr:hypothetical protein XAP6164_1410003 [Xanthomonas phaseoli pv. phaseoli]